MPVSKSKTIVILVFIITSAFLGTSIFNYLHTRASVRKELILSSLPLLSENIYSEIHKELMFPVNISSSMSRDSFLINWVNGGEVDSARVVQYLNKIKEEYGFFSAFFVSEKTGNYYYHNGILKQIDPGNSHDLWYYKFVKSGKEYDLDVDTNEAANNILTVFINFRLEDFDGNLLGVVGVGVKLENITDTLVEKQHKYNRHILLVDEEGIIQSRSDGIQIDMESIFDMPGINTIADMLMVRRSGPVDGSYVNGHKRFLVSARYIPEMDWFIIVEQQEEKALVSAKSNLVLTIAVGVITVVLLVLLSSFTIGNFQKHMEKIASTDTLTNIANRREFETKFGNACYRAERYNVPISLIIIDVDNFKTINDRKGHLKGDKVLIMISRMITELIRPDDLFARWGGDEFVILLEAGRSEASVLAERLRVSISGKKIKHAVGLDSDVTISIGIAGYKTGESLEEMMRRADTALYESKKTGKNKVTENFG